MAGEISLDPTRLKNVKRHDDGSIRAACPACRASGSDKSGEHLKIEPSGKYGCASHPRDHEHRKEIFKLAGNHISQKLATNGAKQFDCAYDYQDASGKLSFQVVRFKNPKDFRQRRPDTNAPDGWTWNTKGVEKVLFRLPEIVRAIASGKFIFLTEGERDTLEMVQRGFDATCNPGGAGKWQDSYTETLRGADVVIIADRDKAGRAHAQLVAAKLHGVAKSVRVMELPDTNGKPVKDAADFFAAGGDAGQIAGLVDSTPEWTPEIKIELSEPDADVRGEIVRILLDGKLTQTEQRTQIANAVVSALAGRGRFFFHADDFEAERILWRVIP